MIKKKSIRINAVINVIKTIVSLIFPLVTYPYISRILGVDNLGRYNFSHSVIDYFYLLSALGIATYAVREGPKHRESREKISEFASEVFTINVLSTVISYCFLFLIVFVSPKLQDYASIIFVLSASMFFTTIGCEWVYTIYEEYLYIALRAIAFQVVSLILLFILVKTKEDVLWYAVAIVVSNSGANVVNVIGLKKYCRIRLLLNKRVLIHLSPILVLFGNSVATRIYVNSDITILGILTTDYNVGIYTIASKIYSIIKRVLSAIIIVSIPRLSLLWGQNRRGDYEKLANRIFYMLITLVIPAAVGLFFLSRNIILVISTKDFVAAEIPLRILSVALFFCLFNWFFSSCILIPCKREKKVLFATVFSAIVNVVLNFILIPVFRESAAALTTLIAEACSLFICFRNSRDLIHIERRWMDIFSTIVGCVLVGIVCYCVRLLEITSILTVVFAVIGSVVVYAICLFLMKNSIVLSLKEEIMKLFRKRV
ncbi:MAG: flippase [Lachnospiraceae bacterium]|jgi:O-antigen/teichoic acid export membrane protein